MSGWVDRPTDRRSTLPSDWWKRRGHVFKRDHKRCQHIRYDTGRKCLAVATDVDHIGDRDDHSYENLQSLCGFHHDQKTGAQGGNAAAANRRNKPAPRHPGIR